MTLLLLIATFVRGPADVESMTAVADVVVRAQVVRQSSAWGKGGGQIFTTVVLRAIETWKGEADLLTVLVPGGELDDLSQTIAGMAVFQEGEEVVLFLRRRTAGVFALERMALGKFSVGAPPGLPKRALRDRRGLECVGCGAAESDDFSLDELRARVLSVRK